MEKQKPKKRGRKPKKEKLIEEKNQNNDLKITDNLIIKLNPVNENNEIVKPYSIETDKIENVNCDNNLKSEVCWNCCHNFNSIVYGIPLKYHEKIFYTYGDFCSYLVCFTTY